jgi:hypothetical protein
VSAQTGALYDTSNVVVGGAVLYVGPSFSLPAPDSATLFDPSLWCGFTLKANGATAVTLNITTASGGPAAVGPVNPTTTTAAALQATIAAAANVGVGNVIVNAIAGGFSLLFNGSLGAVNITLSAQTGGPATITLPVWLPAGATDQGWSFTGTKQTQDITVEEQSSPAGVTMTTQSVSIAGTLAEDVMQSWQWAFNGQKLVTAAASGQPGKTRIVLSDTIARYAVCLETQNKFGMARRVYIPDCVCLDSPNVGFRRAANKRMLAVSFRSVCNINQIWVDEFTAAALP